MLVTRPTHRGSGIALLVETSNAEAHADMYINEYDANNRQGLPAYNQSDITYPWTSTVALNLTNNIIRTGEMTFVGGLLGHGSRERQQEKTRPETRGNGKAVKSRGHVDRDRTFQVKPHAYRYYDDRGGTARKRRVPVQYQGSLFF